jgi:hypothetical protein
MPSITAHSSRGWIDRHPLKLERYLRRYHRLPDRPVVFDLLFWDNPDEGKKLIQNFDLKPEQKKQLLISWLYFEPQITCGVLGDQRMGKDALICEVFQETIDFCEENNFVCPRFVTLGNIKKPPFVADNDMYFSFKNIPAGTKKQEVWIYSSEIETVLPAREGSSAENRLFAQLEGTMAQNHQKLFGCVKLASKVDINFIRGMNTLLCKYISPHKLKVDNVERDNIISPLAMWHLPKDPHDKKQTLMLFDNQIFLVDYYLPEWWSDDYSEQFRNVSTQKIKEYAEVMFSNGLSILSIQTAIAQKFRRIVSKDWLEEVIQT